MVQSGGAVPRGGGVQAAKERDERAVDEDALDVGDGPDDLEDVPPAGRLAPERLLRREGVEEGRGRPQPGAGGLFKNAGSIATLRSESATQIWPSCIVHCSRMLRRASFARAWVAAKGRLTTGRLETRASVAPALSTQRPALPPP